MSKLMTVAMVARQLCITRKRVYQLIDEGRIDSLRTGVRNIRIPRESVEQYVNEAVARERRERGLDLPPMPSHRHAMQ